MREDFRVGLPIRLRAEHLPQRLASEANIWFAPQSPAASNTLHTLPRSTLHGAQAGRMPAPQTLA